MNSANQLIDVITSIATKLNISASVLYKSLIYQAKIDAIFYTCYNLVFIAAIYILYKLSKNITKRIKEEEAGGYGCSDGLLAGRIACWVGIVILGIIISVMVNFTVVAIFNPQLYAFHLLMSLTIS